MKLSGTIFFFFFSVQYMHIFLVTFKDQVVLTNDTGSSWNEVNILPRNTQPKRENNKKNIISNKFIKYLHEVLMNWIKTYKIFNLGFLLGTRVHYREVVRHRFRKPLSTTSRIFFNPLWFISSHVEWRLLCHLFIEKSNWGDTQNLWIS